MTTRSKTVALCGNPNSGKSSIFNELTGLQQKISNVPGTTIERREAKIEIKGDSFRLLDTPGTYSYDPKSKDEEVALEILNTDHTDRPDLLIYVADASNLKRNLLFFSQLSKLGIPMILVLNMLDVARKKGLEIDVDRLEKELGIRIVETNARKGQGVDSLKTQIPQGSVCLPF